MDYEDQDRRRSPEDRMGREDNQRRSRTDYRLADEIEKAIIGEVQAYYSYEELAKLASNEQDRRTIKGIQEDEAKHYNWFSEILKDLGGRVPRIPYGELPKDFEDGVRASIQDELTANEFYLDISYRAMDPDIKMTFLYASQDEQRHATLLLNMLV